MITKEEAIEKELSAAYLSLSLLEYFTDNTILALEKFVRHIVATIELENTDTRAIEGDNELEIRGY